MVIAVTLMDIRRRILEPPPLGAQPSSLHNFPARTFDLP
jgi:hypothetical protein